ncbi:hypothetical protein KIPB_006027 [Kipferlia bialata]|uniref:Uncharacterized protein n=1 Tax=Kipferlia bialata TaxID=797122 RepID=A0A391NPG2_9EUKA|nr:hypothetical protein KIPB_006027 [Kipferlia bialata]|eukprot:g6027.t1
MEGWRVPPVLLVIQLYCSVEFNSDSRHKRLEDTGVCVESLVLGPLTNGTMYSNYLPLHCKVYSPSAET